MLGMKVVFIDFRIQSIDLAENIGGKNFVQYPFKGGPGFSSRKSAQKSNFHSLNFRVPDAFPHLSTKFDSQILHIFPVIKI